jgi:metal-responsive CopG/Arc/MetJ family transcriptional regulator
MKTKTSITLSAEVLARIDRHTGNGGSRSAFIERVLREHFDQRSRRMIHARDLERINAAADRLNREALDVLEDQALD